MNKLGPEQFFNSAPYEDGKGFEIAKSTSENK